MDAKKFARFLRKIISEEVRIVVREELSIMHEQLLEQQQPRNGTKKQIVNETPVIKNSRIRQVESMFSKPSPQVRIKTTGDPIKDLLEETKLTGNFAGGEFGGGLEGGFGSGPVVSGMGHPMVAPVPIVENVQDMIANAEPAFQPEFARVDAVPDFSAMMDKLKAVNTNPNFK